MSSGNIQMSTFAPATIAPMVNANVKHDNPNPNPNPNPYPTLNEKTQSLPSL